MSQRKELPAKCLVRGAPVDEIRPSGFYFGAAELTDSSTPDCQEAQNEPAPTLAEAGSDPTRTNGDFAARVTGSRDLRELGRHELGVSRPKRGR